MLRSDVVQGFLDLFEAPTYLEVGVDSGTTFHSLKAHRKIAVDPDFKFDHLKSSLEYRNAEYHRVTSDQYFGNIIEPKTIFDVIYLDGLHTFEQTLRDLMNGLAYLAPGGIVIIDDVLPSSYSASLPDLQAAFALKANFEHEKNDGSWMGDVYKLVFFISYFLQQYDFATLVDNHGQLVMWRRARPSVMESRTVEWVSRLDFAGLMQHKAEMNISTFQQIIADIRQSRTLEANAPKPQTTAQAGAAGAALKIPTMYGVIPRDVYRQGGFYGSAARLTGEHLIEVPSVATSLIDRASYARPDPEKIVCNNKIFKHELLGLYDQLRANYEVLAPVAMATLPGASLNHNVIYLQHEDRHEVLFETFRPIDRPYILESTQEELSQPALVLDKDETYFYLGSAGSSNYGHWLVDDLPRALLAHQHFSDDIHWLIPRSGGVLDQVKQESLRALIGPDVQISLTPHDETVFVERLLYVSPVSYHPVLKSPTALRGLAERLSPRRSKGGGRKLFVTRKATGQRMIENFDEVSAELERAGFEVIEPGAMTFQDQLQTFSEADSVVGVMGAAMTNTLFCPIGSHVAYLAPMGWTEPFYWDLACVMGHRYRCLFGDNETHSEPHLSNFVVDMGNLRELLDGM